MKALFVVMIVNSFFSSCIIKAEPEAYIIPYRFQGIVYILFGKKNGIPVKYENNRRVYEIPNDGILKTQFTTNDGFINRIYYYLDADGRKIPLTIFHYEYQKDGTIKWIIKNNDEVGIFLDGTSGQMGNSSDSNVAKYDEFIVTSYNLLDSFRSDQYQNTMLKKLEKITGLKLTLQ
jgi:hypothetical protein